LLGGLLAVVVWGCVVGADDEGSGSVSWRWQLGCDQLPRFGSSTVSAALLPRRTVSWFSSHCAVFLQSPCLFLSIK